MGNVGETALMVEKVAPFPLEITKEEDEPGVALSLFGIAGRKAVALNRGLRYQFVIFHYQFVIFHFVIRF